MRPTSGTDLQLEEDVAAATSSFFSATLLLMGLGALIVASGYALSRDANSGAIECYFAGEFLVALAPLLLLYRNKVLDRAIGVWVSIALGMVSFIVVACYSPLEFGFDDEYQHTLTAQSILTSGHLFHLNPALPVSAQFPGLEIVTTEISSLSGLSIFASGTIVAGVCHVVMTGLMFCLAKQFGLTSRASVFAVMVFSSGYTYQAFLSYFAYETIAVPFLIATLIVITKLLVSRHPRSHLLVAGAIFLSFVTIVSHHITSYFLLALASVLILSTYLFSPKRRRQSRPLLVLLSIIVLLAFWNFVVAPETVHYLNQIVNQIRGIPHIAVIRPPDRSVSQYVTSGNSPVVVTPLPLRLLGDFGVAAVILMLPIGAWTIWKRRVRRRRYIWIMPVLAAVAYYALLPLFVLAPGGDGLAGRAQVLLLIPAGLVAAVGLEPGLLTLSGKHTRLGWRLRSYLGIFLIAIIIVGAVPASYPGFASKLPAPYNVDAITRSYDRRTVLAGMWASDYLGPHAAIAADTTDSLMLEAIAGTPVIDQVATLFETGRFTSGDDELALSLKLGYIFTDYRLTTETPADGSNFGNDPLSGVYRSPLPRRALRKFNHERGLDRIFDDGSIVIYSVTDSELRN
jgi:hypothetical protein